MADHSHGGDLLALNTLDQWRENAFSRGYAMTRSPRASRAAELKRAIEAGMEPLGDAVVQPAGTGDVGSGARPSHRDPHPISMLLERVIKDRGWQQKIETAAVFARWPQIVGETVAKNCQVESFTDDGVLTLRTSSTSWETQIRALLATLDATLAREIGPGVVKDIVVKGPERPQWSTGRYSVRGSGIRNQGRA